MSNTGSAIQATNQLEHTLCRLCGGPLAKLFTKTLLGKYDVKYYKCFNCQSLQTENPYWLGEAYESNNLSNSDTGAAQRNLRNLSACYIIAKLLKLNNIVDIGGGDGLLCRMLRDYKMNCYVEDKYAKPTYAQGFTERNFSVPDFIIGFEVLEHYPNPLAELDKLFSQHPRALLFSTALFTDEKQDWWYLAPESGQHVFFYSKNSMAIIAEKYNYALVISGGFTLFLKNSTAFEKLVSKIVLKGSIVRLFKAILFLLPTPGVWRDHLLQVEKSKRAYEQT